MGSDTQQSDPWKRSTISKQSMPRRSPWCPSAEDGLFLKEAAAPALAGDEATLLVLGVTLEVIAIDWPAQARLVTVDSSAGIIASIWQPNPSVASQAICAWWQDMPIEDASVAAAVGDGSLNALTALDQYPVVLGQVARVLRPGGVLALRCFVQSDTQESAEQLFDDARRGLFPDISGFRFRLAMAMAETDQSVALSEVPEAFARHAPDRAALAAATGWSRAQIEVTDAGAGSPIRVTFPTEAELHRQFAPWFHLEDIRRGHYVEADCCPTWILRRR